MDRITREITDMYGKFPYPAPCVSTHRFKELVNLLKIFSMENRFDFAGKTVLDAGTGTGHRLIEAAAAFKNTSFTAVDVCESSLDIARQTALREGLQNVEFRHLDLMRSGALTSTFDVILSMGVIHVMSDPAAGLRNLVGNLAEDGICFLYLYGKHGGRERMRRKAIVSLLLQAEGQDFERGIRLVRELGFDRFEYGWNLGAEDEEGRNALIVDAFLNVNEKLFELDSICELMEGSGLAGFVIYGITLEQYGCLFDSRLEAPAGLKLKTTDVAARLSSPLARQAYEQLPLRDKCRIVDLLFEPNGYTIVGFKSAALRQFAPGSRILANLLTAAPAAADPLAAGI